MSMLVYKDEFDTENGEDNKFPRRSKRVRSLPYWINVALELVSYWQSDPNSHKEAMNSLEMWKWTDLVSMK